MKLTRRDFVILGLGALAAGCAGQHGTGTGGNLGGSSPTPTPGGLPSSLHVIPRSEWAEADPIASKLTAMNGISRITVHHEGGSAVWFNDYESMQTRMDQIRESHLDRLGAADIGYHLVIDRAGRIWQGRDIRYQGAHVHPDYPRPDFDGPEARSPQTKVAWNQHNLGIMVLGNFQLQSPTAQQLSTLKSTLAVLMQHYRVPVERVYTHQELNNTECPGQNLQPVMDQYRDGPLSKIG